MNVNVIADSISTEGVRITTLHLRYWRGIHSELMTHRVFSRNARSSRAVPVATMLNEVENDPFVPSHWGKNQKGMQAGEEHNAPVELPIPYVAHGGMIDGNGRGQDQRVAYRDKPFTREQAWLSARGEAVAHARAFMAAGYHKQIVNRLLEPFMYIDTLVTSTEWSNFDWLRIHGDAEPHFEDLAKLMYEKRENSVPQMLYRDKWHLPYFDEEKDSAIIAEFMAMKDRPDFDVPQGLGLYDFIACQLSAARCARISYKPFDGNADLQSELRRYEGLISGSRVHASPLEHQATPDDTLFGEWCMPSQHGNLVGWRQYRKMIPGESR